MRRKKSKGLILFAFVFLIFYIFLFPGLSGKELYLKPVWVRDLEDGVGKGSEQPVFAFKMGQHFGYADLEGRIHYLDRVLYGVALAENGFINFPRITDNFVFQNTLGGFEFSFQSSGYPLLEGSGETLYMVTTDLSGIRQYSLEWDLIWSFEFSSAITSVSLDGRRCLLGLLDGRAKLIEPHGGITYEYSPEGAPGGGRIPVILATALRGRQMALISGIDPQSLLLIGRKGGEFSYIHREILESDFRRELILQFSKDGRHLVFEQDGRVGLFDLARRRMHYISLPGRLFSLSSSLGMLALSSTNGDLFHLKIVATPDRVIYDRTFEPSVDFHGSGKGLFLNLIDNHLIIGQNGALMRIDISE